MKSKISILLFITLSVVGCRTTKQHVNRTYKEIIRDTIIYIHLPTEYRETIVQDSSLLVGNAMQSFAKIRSDGSLYHNIQTLPTPISVNVPLKESIIRTDSIIIRPSVNTDSSIAHKLKNTAIAVLGCIVIVLLMILLIRR